MYFVVLLVLVLVLAIVYASSATSPPPEKHGGEAEAPLPEKHGGEAEAPPDRTRFPFRSLVMDTPHEMFARLCNERPRKRKKSGGYDVLLLRDLEDYVRVDGLADHYTEQLRATQTPPGVHLPSQWDYWSKDSYRQHIEQFAAPNASRVLALRGKLEEMSPSIHDTNPVLARWLLRSLASQMRMESYQMRVLDGNCGWGGQTLAACAADVGCYHGYLPFDTQIRPSLAKQLLLLLESHMTADMPENEFWIRQMPPPLTPFQPSGGRHYDVLLFHVSDLTPFATYLTGGDGPFPDVWKCVRPGGAVVLFVGPSQRELARALSLVKGCRGRPEPQLYAIREHHNGEVVHSKALVWSKIEH